MPLIVWIIAFCLLGGVLSVLAASLFLALRESWRARLMPHLISYAIGALLGAAFLGLLPHAFSAGPDIDVHNISLAVLIGVLSFFLLEKAVLWRHCHSHECEVHGDEPSGGAHHGPATGTLILVGDGIHNLVDGVLIAAAFMTDIHLGVVTALAVAAHEIPQEVGDFSILLHSGFSRGRALFYNVLASLTTVVGGFVAWLSLGDAQHLLPYVLAVAASSFIYIAVADLIPGLHHRTEPHVTAQQIVLIALGVVTIYSVHSILH